MHEVAAALDGHERATGRRGERGALRVRTNRVLVAVDHQDRAADARAELVARPDPRQPQRLLGVDQGLRVGLEPPGDEILDQLGRVWLRDALPEEVLEEFRVVLEPVVTVVLGPALVGVEPLVEVVHGPLGVRRASATAGPMKTAPSTRSGCSAASSVPQSAPHERPTSTQRSVEVASRTASASAANSGTGTPPLRAGGRSGRCRARRM